MKIYTTHELQNNPYMVKPEAEMLCSLGKVSQTYRQPKGHSRIKGELPMRLIKYDTKYVVEYLTNHFEGLASLSDKQIDSLMVKVKKRLKTIHLQQTHTTEEDE